MFGGCLRVLYYKVVIVCVNKIINEHEFSFVALSLQLLTQYIVQKYIRFQYII